MAHRKKVRRCSVENVVFELVELEILLRKEYYYGITEFKKTKIQRYEAARRLAFSV
jgi:hypothetical protein